MATYNGHMNETTDQCKDCGRSSKSVRYCVDCDSHTCGTCWNQIMVHKPGRTNRDGMPHEKIDYRVYDRLNRILHPRSDEHFEQLHDVDRDTMWFGMTRDQSGYPMLIDGDIYASLMAQAPKSERIKYPQLVSFIGQKGGQLSFSNCYTTNSSIGAGKSTLIKMLIGLQECRLDSSLKPSFPSPVVGSPLQETMLEIPVAGRRSRRRLASSLISGRARMLEWANTADKKTKQFAVTELYPRILYTFSDVVVFVLRNARTFQSTALTKLVEWDAASLEKSINQPTLPHAITAVNATEIGVNNKEWNVEYATQSLLDSVGDSLGRPNGVPALIKHANKWRNKGKEIHSVLDLIHCYYSSFSVVRIPVGGRYSLLEDQINKLQKRVRLCCEVSYDTKSKARMISNSDELNVYLQLAYDHFAKRLDTPFNFFEVSLKNNPIPLDFGGHILQLAVSIQLYRPEREINENHLIFEDMSSVVASSVSLDCVRFHRKGMPTIALHRLKNNFSNESKGLSQELFKEYERFFDYALREFCAMHLPCEFSNHKGKCVNMSSRHNPKGHQNERGKIIAAGKHQSGFIAEEYSDEWMDCLEREVVNCQKKLQDSDNEERILEIHHRQLNESYRSPSASSSLRSYSLYCLRQSYGKRVAKFVIKMESCLMHSYETRNLVSFNSSLNMLVGGIRGIVELEVLRAIQVDPGNQIPIRAFFDLMVGRRLCPLTNAFTPREFHGVPGLEQIAIPKHGSKYRNSPLQKALQNALGLDRLFRGCHEDEHKYETKVAVTATDETGRKAITLGNYSRPDASRGNRRRSNYEFPRPDDPFTELTLWEAAAATSAAPPYFEPFIHSCTGRTYLDGAFYNNNPVRVVHRERKLLWPDLNGKHPDILLSLGTSQHESMIRRELETVQGRSEARNGKICCRFEDNPPYLRALGDFLHLQQRRDFQPYFEVEEDNVQAEIRKIVISEGSIQRMQTHAAFELDVGDMKVSKRTAQVSISLFLGSKAVGKTPISGFPRQLMIEDSAKFAQPPPDETEPENLVPKKKSRRSRTSTGMDATPFHQRTASGESERDLSQPAQGTGNRRPQVQNARSSEADSRAARYSKQPQTQNTGDFQELSRHNSIFTVESSRTATTASELAPGRTSSRDFRPEGRTRAMPLPENPQLTQLRPDVRGLQHTESSTVPSAPGKLTRRATSDGVPDENETHSRRQSPLRALRGRKISMKDLTQDRPPASVPRRNNIRGAIPEDEPGWESALPQASEFESKQVNPASHVRRGKGQLSINPRERCFRVNLTSLEGLDLENHGIIGRNLVGHRLPRLKKIPQSYLEGKTEGIPSIQRNPSSPNDLNIGKTWNTVLKSELRNRNNQEESFCPDNLHR
ncbi:uncharacterized protein BDZ99DRAFT_555088 [Mytilinidion resinicola]|uniref:PNPLA domain-containing protein n=1 Tax=Mytilinidion resinicola TaxID=574789 RepID=A0A6A6Z2M0_9PEZI|nr:uncharacterized protein BDZ99DRAFT_555088 [Mytilinidion resinicola]KAF2814425.1 hypothetical protein BDZ99DRAFT_555088 [Mytilinidion resinicola]